MATLRHMSVYLDTKQGTGGVPFLMIRGTDGNWCFYNFWVPGSELVRLNHAGLTGGVVELFNLDDIMNKFKP